MSKQANPAFNAPPYPTAPPPMHEEHRRVNENTQQADPPPPPANAYAAGPPPAYAEAIHYPTMNAYQPNTQPMSYGVTMPQPNTNAPYPHPPPPIDGVPNAAATTVHIVQQPVPVIIGEPCRFCRTGVVRNDSDVCCMIFLVMLAIFTFPFGLVFLCCLPCATRRRCTNCRRLH